MELSFTTGGAKVSNNTGTIQKPMMNLQNKQSEVKKHTVPKWCMFFLRSFFCFNPVIYTGLVIRTIQQVVSSSLCDPSAKLFHTKYSIYIDIYRYREMSGVLSGRSKHRFQKFSKLLSILFLVLFLVVCRQVVFKR